MSSLLPTMLHHIDPSCRPRESCSVAVLSPAVDQAIFFLRSHAVTLTAADGVNASSPMVVGRPLETQLAVPVHSLRVTAHHPEHFFVIFTQPAHQVNAVRRGSIRIDGAVFNVASWHENDHASFGFLLLHVRVVVEDVPMHFWSVEGAEEILGKRVRVDRLDSRTLERGHTKTFACWVWTDDVASIPTRHTLGVLPRGAGCVDEMEGFSPPDRRVAPPLATAEYSMLIHVDRVEGWTPLSPRSSHSGQSDVPSSSSDEDDRPFPAVAPASWKMGIEDGQRDGRHRAHARAPVTSLGCRGMPRGGRGHDSEGDNEGNADDSKGKDPVDDLFKTAKKPMLASLIVDGMAADIQAATDAVVVAPLQFDENSLPVPEGEALQLDAFSPTLLASASDFGHFNRATPTSARTMEVQLGAVTSQVSQLELVGADEQAPSLFRGCRPPLISASPARRSVPPPKSRASAAPTRHNARQAANTSTVPVAQRASLRIVKELGLLGPRERMTEDVAKAQLHRFEEPLTDGDIAVIAKLTRLDGEALRVMARMAGPDGVAEKAVV
ncbi:D-3-phosphoglycerate dehydrogenase, chloroplastic [Hordeum vulgare]|nr:D-3-phosphoglycerate dehydrogenase, chloroplastic [Hordeum vulgare]